MKPETKVCRDCGLEKQLNQFYYSSNGKLKRAAYCKPCSNLRGKKSRGTDELIKETLPEDMHRCGRCKEVKIKDQFYKNQNECYTQCKKCSMMVSRNWQISPGGERKVRNAGFVRKYGITLKEYEAMLVAQKYLCCICEIDLRTTKADLDHCHATGKNRGILCHNCNCALGFLKDNPQFCASAGRYLEKHLSTKP